MTDDNSSSPAHRPSAHHDGAAQQPGYPPVEQLHPRSLGLADPSEARGLTTDDLAALVASLAPNLDANQLGQLQRELQGWASGYDRLMLAWRRDIERGDPLRHSPIRRLMDSFVHPLADDLTARAEAATASRGRRPSWLHLAFDPLGARELAAIVVSAILTEVLEHGLKLSRRLRDRPLTDTQLAIRIGHEVSHAARLAAWKQKHPALFKAFTDRLDKDGATDRHRKTVMALGLGKLARYVIEGDGDDTGDEGEAAVPEGTAPWPEVEQRRVGHVLVYAAMRAAPALISSELVRARKASSYRMHINPDLLAWAQEAMHRKALATTVRRPMLCPPLPWTGPTGGGYLLGIGSNRHLVSGGERASRKAQRDAIKTDPPRLVLDAINAVQSVPWEINPHVLSIAREAADNGIDLPGLPQSFVEPLPPKPLDFDTSTEAQKKWRREAAVVHNLNARRTRKAVAALATVNEATELSQVSGDRPSSEPAFWFPAFVDNRGRLYAYGSGLNPHGNDLSRSLLRFANGKPIGERKVRPPASDDAPPACGPTALAARVAGAFGHDKLSWSDRIRWTEDNEALLRRIADDPLGNRREWEAEADGDGIWSALAAAREWTDYLDSGRSPAFVTKLPCYIDGTCNGIQHFAALARDETLGQLVNLLLRSSASGPGPSDVYQSVANKLLDLLHEARDHGTPEDRLAANLWLRLRPFKGNKAPRSIAKQAVMTKPYGASFGVLLEEVGKFWEEHDGPDEWRDVLLQDDEGETEVRKLRGWLAKKLQAALSDTAHSADAIMKWLQASARLMLKHGVEIDPPWRTPSGWPWLSKYQSIDEHRHKLTQPGERPREFSTYTENLTKPDKRGQTAGIAPNFVQGLDASALMLAVSKMTAAGVIAVTTIHDSVGCLAPDMPVVARAVREGFVETHEADPLASYREAVLAALPNDKARAKLPPLPKRGNLNIRGVLDADYFFC